MNKRTIAAVVISLAAIAIAVGCNGMSKGKYTSQKNGQYSVKVQFADDGRPTVDVGVDRGTTTHSQGETQAAPGAKDGTTLDMSDDGLATGIGGTYAAQAIDYIKKGQGNLIYIGIGIAFFGLVLTVLPASRLAGFAPVGVGAIIFGTCTCFLPTVINYAGPWLAGLLVVLAVVAVVGGVIWLFAKRSGKSLAFKAARQRANTFAATAAANGDTGLAMGIRRSADPSYDAAIEGAKLQEAVKAVRAADPLSGASTSAAVVPMSPAGGTPTSVAATPVVIPPLT